MALKLKGSTSGFVGLDAPAVAGNNTLILPENSGSAFQLFGNDITAGVTTFTQVTVSRNGDLTVPGTISIGGTLTYEDVTSVDSVGIVTARGLSIFGNTSGLQVASGISTFQALTGTTGTFSSDVSIADKIVHTGDTDTAIRFPATNYVTIESAGVEKVEFRPSEVTFNDTGIDCDFRIEGDSNANLFKVDAGNDRIGVGLAAPQQVFHVYHASDNGLALFESGDANCRIDLKDNSGQASVEAIGDTLRFGTSSSNTERLRINSTGQLLINTTDGTGAYHLVVSNPSNSDTGMSFRGSGSSQQRIRFADGTSGGAESIGQVEYNHANNSLAIDTNGAEAVRIDSSARVMIQTTTEGHADSDDLTIGDTGDNRIGITLRSAEYGNIFFSDATSGAAEYQGIIQYYHTDDVFNVQLGGAQKVTIGANNIALFGADNLSARGNNYYGVDVAYKGSGIQGRSNNPTLDLCSNVSANINGNGYVYGEGNTTAGQLSVGGAQLIFSSAGSGTAGASATLTEKFRFNSNNTMIFGSQTSNASAGSVHIANAFLRLQAAQQSSVDFSQEVGIEWSQEAGSDVQVGKIVMRRVAWGGAPHSMDFYSRNSSNQVQRNMTIDHDGGIYFQNLLGNAASGSAVKYSNSDDELRYDTSSKLLKTNIAELTKYGIDTVKNLKPCTFTPQEYNKDGTITVSDETLIGFLADEMVTEVPEVVQMYSKSTLTKQEEDTEIVPAAISYDKLTVVLTKALQEAIAKIETLEAKVAALEGS